jgi:hypothetical protein
MPDRRNPFSSFADPDSFLGQPILPRVGAALSTGGSMVGEAASRAASGLGRTASTLGSALTFPITAAQQAVSGRPLISGAALGRGSRPEPPTPATTTFPSGTSMVGFDSYPTMPQTVSNVAASAPQPAASTNVPAFPNVGMGIMGNQNVGPLPTEQFSPMARIAPTLADRGNVTTDITGMQGKVPIQTPYGTVYATAGQAQTQRVSEMGGLPAQSARLANIGEQAQRSANIAQMRERGAALGQQGLQRQERFFTQKRAEREALNVAEDAARAAGASSMDVMRARSAVSGPSTIAGIRRQFETYQPQIGPMAPTSTLVANAVSGFTGGLPAGGSQPLPAGPMGPSGYALYERQQMARRRGRI